MYYFRIRQSRKKIASETVPHFPAKIADFDLKYILLTEMLKARLQGGTWHGDGPKIQRKGVLRVRIFLIHASKDEEFKR